MLRGLLIRGSGTRRKAARVTGVWERAAGEGVGLLAGRAGEGGGKVACWADLGVGLTWLDWVPYFLFFLVFQTTSNHTQI